MLDERDVRVISGLLDTRFDAFEQKVDTKFAAFEQKLDQKLDLRFEKFEEKMSRKFDEFEKKITHSIGEMLEQNVFPQFDDMHRELQRINGVISLRH